MNKENCALKLVDEIILYYDARSKKYQTTNMILLCSLLMTWSMLWWHASLLCKRAVHGRGRNDEHCRIIIVVLAKHEIAP